MTSMLHQFSLNCLIDGQTFVRPWLYTYINFFQTFSRRLQLSKNIIRTTISFDPGLHKNLRINAAENYCSISKLVNQAVRIVLDADSPDPLTVNMRKSGAHISCDKMVEQIKQDGFIEEE